MIHVLKLLEGNDLILMQDFKIAIKFLYNQKNKTPRDINKFIEFIENDKNYSLIINSIIL